MDTNRFIAHLQLNHAAREKAKSRRTRKTEVAAFCSGGMMVFTGLLLAVLFSLLTHRIVV